MARRTLNSDKLGFLDFLWLSNVFPQQIFSRNHSSLRERYVRCPIEARPCSTDGCRRHERRQDDAEGNCVRNNGVKNGELGEGIWKDFLTPSW